MRLPRARNEREERSGFSRMPREEEVRSSWEGTELSTEVMEEPGDRREEVEVVVLLLERPLKTDKRFGEWV